MLSVSLRWDVNCLSATAATFASHREVNIHTITRGQSSEKLTPELQILSNLPSLSVNEFIVWSPEGFRRCDFEEDLCEWDLSSLSKLKWVRTNQENISITDPLKGPGRDHSNNSATGLKWSVCFSPWKPYCCSVSLPVCSVWLSLTLFFTYIKNK